MHVVSLLAASDAPGPKDVVIATLGASAALGGFVLVFLGLIVSSYQAYPSNTPEPVKASAREAGWPILALFVVCLASVGLGFIWLEGGGGKTLYAVNDVVFAAELVGIVLTAVCTARKMLA
jgi:hypothetical protein